MDYPAKPVSADKIEVEEYPALIAYTGSQEDLISAGVATSSMFPEGRKRTKRHRPRATPNEGWEVRRLSGGCYEVAWFREYQDYRDRPLPLKAPRPWDPSFFRGDVRAWGEHFFDRLKQLADGTCERNGHIRGTHRLDDETIAAIEALGHELRKIIGDAHVLAADEHWRPELRVVR